MKKNDSRRLLLLFVFFSILLFRAEWARGQVISEYHYDNDGTDANELVEIWIPNPQPSNLSLYSITAYEGTAPGGINSVPANLNTLPVVCNADGCYYLYLNSLENGPDGIALCGPGGVIQFISYEGTFSANGGCANGIMSVAAMNQADTPANPSGSSIEWNGTTWVNQVDNSPNAVNNSIPTQAAITLPTACLAPNNTFSITVCAQNALGVNALGFTGAITLSKASGSGTLSGTLVGNAVNGCFTFSGLSVSLAGDYTFNASVNNSAASAVFGPTTVLPTITQVSSTLSVVPACQLLITEIQADSGTGDGQGSEWFELYNPTAAAIDISCYVITDGDWVLTIPPGTSVPAGAFFTIGNQSLATCPDCEYAADGFGLNGFTYSLNTDDLFTQGYFTGPTINTCGGVRPNLTLNSATGEQLAIFSPNSNTDPVYAVAWNGGDANASGIFPDVSGQTAVAPAATCTSSAGEVYAIQDPATNPSGFYDQVVTLPSPFACSSSFAYVNGAWIEDDTPTPNMANDASSYIINVDGIDYPLNTLTNVDAPQWGTLPSFITVCGAGSTNISFTQLDYQHLDLCPDFTAVGSTSPCGYNHSSGGGRGSFIRVVNTTQGTDTYYPITAAQSINFAAGDVGYFEFQVREYAYGANAWSSTNCDQTPITVSLMSSDCIIKKRVNFVTRTEPLLGVITTGGCYGANRYNLTVNVSGGTAPYYYETTGGVISSGMLGSTGPFTVGTFVAGGPGFTITVKDANGCIATPPTPIVPPAACSTCGTETAGTASVTPTQTCAGATITLSTVGSSATAPNVIGWAMNTAPITATNLATSTFIGNGATFVATAPAAGIYYYAPFLADATGVLTQPVGCADIGTSIQVQVLGDVTASQASVTYECIAGTTNYNVIITAGGGLPAVDPTQNYTFSGGYTGLLQSSTSTTKTYAVGPIAVGTSPVITVGDGVACTVDPTITATSPTCVATLGNLVFIDNGAGGGTANDGILNGTEVGINGVTVNLLDENGELISTTTTAGGGLYSFTNLPATSYSVQYVLPTGYAWSGTTAATNDPATNNEQNAIFSSTSQSTATSPIVTLAAGDNNVNLDASLRLNCPDFTNETLDFSVCQGGAIGNIATQTNR
jgi:hypothetical protein